MKALISLIVILAAARSAYAANIETGKQLATTVCAACHGPSGISVSDTVPNLAGQRARYIEAQLKFFKDGTRKEPGGVSQAAIMNAIAAQLSPEDIANVAAYFESQPGAAPGTKSALLPNIAAAKIAFPQDYKLSFTKYYTKNFPPAKEVRYYYANIAAVTAAKAGKPLPDGSVIFVEIYSTKLDANNNPITGADGFYVPDQLLRYTAMEREAGWGAISPKFSATKIGIMRFSPRPNSISTVSIRLNVWPATSPCPT